MFKFLRKYNKWILAVGGSLLMVVFLVPTAIEGLANQAARGGAEIATFGPDNLEITQPEWQSAQKELEILQTAMAGRQVMFGPIQVDSPEHWFLLSHEAAKLGLEPGPATGYANIAPMQGGTQEGTLNTLSGLARAPRTFVLETLAKATGVREMVNLYGATPWSDRRLRNAAARMFHGVSGEIVVIQPDPAASDFEPTEEQILEQFNAYADIEPGAGDMGFGYRLPDRVKLMWMKINRESVEDLIEASGAINGIALQKHWRKNAGVLGEPIPGAEPPVTVRNDLLRTLTDEKIAEITKYAEDQIRAARRGLPERSGYVELPEDWTEDYEGLAAALAERFGIARPEVQTSDGWLDPREVAMLDDIGTATTDKFGATPRSLANLVAAAREFGGAPTIIIQEGVTGPSLTGPDGSTFLFRIAETDAARAPRSVDEVREAVVADLKRLDVFNELKAKVDEIRQNAIENGMLQTAVTYGGVLNQAARVAEAPEPFTLLFQAQAGIPLSSDPPPLPILGAAPEVSSKIVDAALALPRTAQVTTLPAADRITAIAADQQLAVVVFKINGQRPLTREDYETVVNTGLVQSLLLGEEMDRGEDVLAMYGEEAMINRYNFAFVREVEDPAIDGETQIEEALATDPGADTNPR